MSGVGGKRRDWAEVEEEKNGRRKVLYHSVLLVRTDGQELRRRKRIRDHWVVDRLRGRLERTDRLREEGKKRWWCWREQRTCQSLYV